MDTKHLTTFVTLAHEKTYLKTSEVLSYASSTLIAHIEKLEQELGVKLVETVGRQSLLTPAGQAFLPHAQEILRAVENAKKGLHDNAGSGRVVVTAIDSMSAKLEPLFSEYMRRYPHVNLVVKTGNSYELGRELKQGHADAAFLYEVDNMEDPELDSWYLFHEQMPFAVAPSHRLALKAEIGPRDLNHETFFQCDMACYSQVFQKLVKKENLQIENQVQMVSAELIRRYALKGRGVAVLPESLTEEAVAEGKLVYLNWTGPTLGIRGRMLARKERARQPEVNAFLDFVLDYFGRN